jgi:hypothetical protein
MLSEKSVKLARVIVATSVLLVATLLSIPCGWFAWFRFYGPEKALFDKSWTMPDIELLN